MTALAAVIAAAEEIADYTAWLRDQGRPLDGNVSLGNRINRYQELRESYTEGEGIR